MPRKTDAHLVSDNTKPSARMGRKAQRVSLRQPGRRNTARYPRSRLFICIKRGSWGFMLTEG